MPRLVFRVADLLEVTAVAFGFAGLADLAAMMDELMREGNPAVLRNDLHELLLDLLRCVAFGNAEAAGDAKDVGVDDHAFSLAEADAENHVGRLSRGAGDGDQLGEGLRNLPAEFGDDLAGRALNGFGLVVKEARRADEGFELRQGRFGHRVRGREARNNSGVTMLTRTSVHWAERMVATSSSHGDE